MSEGEHKMEDFNKKVKGLCDLMEELKAEQAAIVNPELVSLDEYTKTLYLKVLGTVVQYENIASDIQVFYLKRIVSGMEVELPLEEYLKKALEISEKDIREFTASMKEGNTKYYFALDALIVASMGYCQQENYEYLANLMQLMGIDKQELKTLCLTAKSVLQQESSFYDEAKQSAGEYIKQANFFPYISNYYAGAIVDTEEESYYSAPSRKKSKEIEYPIEFRKNKVTFQNLDINLEHDFKFSGCDNVRFYNCVITGNEASIYLKGCKNVEFEKCRFQDFKKRTLIEENTGMVNILECEFENCRCKYDFNEDLWHIGGVICDIPNGHTINVLKKTVFKNCATYTRDRAYSVNGIISNAKCIVDECEFYNCDNYVNGIVDASESLFNKISEDKKNNKGRGSTPLIGIY